MSTTTTNYGLIKPGTDDPILVGQLNDNMDTIDTVLKDHSDKIDAAALGIKYKGEVNYYADLPNSAEIGDAYTVKYAGSSGTTPDGTEYVWGTVSGTNQWINFSKDSYTKAEVDALLALKQNALSSTQLDAVNSGVDSTKVAQIETNKNNISLIESMQGKKNYLQLATTINVDGTGITVTKNSDNSITINGTSTTTCYVYLNSALILPAGTYVMYCPQANTTNIQMYDNGIWNAKVNNTRTFDGNTSTFIIIRISSGQTIDNVTFYPMIITNTMYDSGLLEYQPYAMSNAELTAAIQAIQAQLAQ
jgi:hypothetical protein